MAESGEAGFRVRKCKVRRPGRSSSHSFNSQDLGAGGEPHTGGHRQGAQLRGETRLGQSSVGTAGNEQNEMSPNN